MTGRIARMAGLCIAVALPLTACTSLPGVTAESCIDWVFFETPAEAVDDADAVAVGHLSGQAGTTTYLDLPANTWTVEVDDWLKGGGDDEIVVTSLPPGCGDGSDRLAGYQDLDDVVFFLRDADDGWQIITPYQGAIPADADGGVPTAWPEDATP